MEWTYTGPTTQGVWVASIATLAYLSLLAYMFWRGRRGE